jgi:hypothetical protein
LVEEGYYQLVKLRGVDPGHKVLQIFADPFELKQGENREESSFLRR